MIAGMFSKGYGYLMELGSMRSTFHINGSLRDKVYLVKLFCYCYIYLSINVIWYV